MKVYETKSAINALFYLLAVDGNIDEDELKHFDEIGEELDPKEFKLYKDSLLESCREYIGSIEDDDDYYDVISEGLDFSLSCDLKSEDCGVTGRLLVWNMLVIAFTNQKYDSREKRLISHVARISNVPKDIVLDMEHSLQAVLAIQKELDWIKGTDKPYGEVQPMVENLENRLSIILESAKALIEDEVVLDDPFEFKPDFVDKAKDAVGEAIAPAIEVVSDKAKNAGDVALKAGKSVGNSVSGVWKGIINKKNEKMESKEDK